MAVPYCEKTIKGVRNYKGCQEHLINIRCGFKSLSEIRHEMKLNIFLIMCF